MALNNVFINDETESLDDLQNGCHIIQPKKGFRFGMDAVLLSDFAKQCRGRVMDMCTGTGIVAVLLAAKSKAEYIDAVEIQPMMAEMAQRSVAYNGLEGRINVACADVRDASKLYPRGSYDAVTVNPPYIKAGSGLESGDRIKLISRTEVKCTLSDVTRQAAALLHSGGSLYMIHRPTRLGDIICTLRGAGLEAKLMRFVAPKRGKEPNLVLVQGIKDANEGMKLLPQLYVYGEDGGYSKEIDEIYGR